MEQTTVQRVDWGSFVRPAEETGTGAPRVEPVLGYVVRTRGRVILVDTGIGDAGDETEAWYRPRRIPAVAALMPLGLRVDEVDLVVNCHLHFDHIGANPDFQHVPIVCQRQELEAARRLGYTAPGLVDFPGATYELIEGETEVAPGVHVIPTPGHVAGHQSVVVRCENGNVIVAGQSHDTASGWSGDVLAARAQELGHQPPLPEAPAWVAQLLEFDPRRVYFAHDHAVWIAT